MMRTAVLYLAEPFLYRAKDCKKKRKKSRKVAQSSASLDTAGDETTAASFSWGSAFAAASQLKPAKGLEEEFLQQATTEPNNGENEGLVKVSQIAAAAAAAKKVAGGSTGDSRGNNDDDSDSSIQAKATKPSAVSRKRRRSDSGGSDSGASFEDEPQSLEGRMVPHPNNASEQVMILVDSKQNLVYSTMERTSDGDYLRVGTLQDNQVVWDEGAFAAEVVNNETDEESQAKGPVLFPFPTDADDHCESPLEAYQDVAPLLQNLCNSNSKSDLCIYDPYYCNGAVKRNLSELGFTNVHNVKEDCYQVWSSGVGYPDFDVLLTNPPYSGDHIEKLLQHVTSRNYGNRPWMLLLPMWVHKKDYYKQLTSHLKPFYLVPKKRYTYLPPKQFREKKASDVHRKSSPFVSMWYIWGGTHAKNEEWIRYCMHMYGKDANGTCDVARSKSALRDLRRNGKRKNGK